MAIVVVDFDGTVVTHEYPNVGKDIGAVPVLKALVENGHKLICFTMRGPGTKEETEAKAWFEKNGIPLYGFNENPAQASWSQSRKVYAQVYIDDAALGCPLISEPKLSDRPFVNWFGVAKYLLKMRLISDTQYIECTEQTEEILNKYYDKYYDRTSNERRDDALARLGASGL